MAINIVGTSFKDLKKAAYEGRDQHDVAKENFGNIIDILSVNTVAAKYDTTTFINTYPNMALVEQNIRNW